MRTRRPQLTIPDTVRQYSSDKIRDAMLRIKLERLPSSRWLKDRNRYASDTIRKIEAEGDYSPLHPNEIAEYIAASSVLHCSDGWLFFSNAVEDLMNGDVTTAVFMAYYAQLRAVMSFFASEGIGVFNYKHIWFNNKGKPHTFGGGTHKVARKLIEDWSSEPLNGDRILNILKLENISFSDWANEAQIIRGSAAIAQLAKDWLKEWSLDLEVLANDHEFRNEVSYRPQKIIPQLHKQNFEECLEILISIWKSSEPYGTSSFYAFDRHLLRNSLSSLFFRRTGINPLGSSDYQNFITTAMLNLGLNPQDQLSKFLVFNSEPQEHLILAKAREQGKNSDGSLNVLSILSRAFILLRLSSAATENLLAESAIARDDLEFWWNEIGLNLGYWLPGDEPAQMSDLWEEIRESIEEIEKWRVSAAGNLNLKDLRQNFSLDVKQFAQFNRVGLWALGL